METITMETIVTTLKPYIILFIVVALSIGIISVVSGAATTGAVTDISTTQAMFHGSGAGNDGWFEWGGYSGGYHWITPNQTYSGTFYEVQIGAPMLTGETYYVRACDNTGCGAEVTWNVPEADVPNRTAYGAGFIQIVRSGFNMTTLLGAITLPYTMVMPGGAPVVWMMLFFFIFAGYWLRPRDIFIPCMLAMVAGGFIWMGGVHGTALGVPPEIMPIGQGLFYAAITGVIVSWFSK